MLKPSRPGERVTLLPSDVAILSSPEQREELPCTVTARKVGLGFDLRFHPGFDVTIPLNELAGNGQILTVLFRVYSQADPSHPAYFIQRFNVPAMEDNAKGAALLQGVIDVGEGAYHVDWLMRDRSEHICSANWDFEAQLAAKDKPMPLFIRANQIAESYPEPFVNDTSRPAHATEDSLNMKLLVNFAPQDPFSTAMQRSDTEALVSILKAIQRDPHVGHISLIAFSMVESRVIYRQDTADEIDFPALGRALQTVKFGTVDLQHLSEKHSETAFLQTLIEKEVGASSHPDAVVFAGPKVMLDADVPQDDLRRIANIECPVFYMNYNLYPQSSPWKDSISHAIRAFKGTEYTISQPRDLWLSTSEMVSRIVRFKREKGVATAAAVSHPAPAPQGFQ